MEEDIMGMGQHMDHHIIMDIMDTHHRCMDHHHRVMEDVLSIEADAMFSN